MMHSSDRAFETKLNINLSTILNEKLGIQSISEKRQGKGRPDILIYSGGIKLIIEGSYSKQDAESDIRIKMEKGFGDIGIALNYKQRIPDIEDAKVRKLLERSRLEAKIFTPRDITETIDFYVNGKRITSVAESEWFQTNVLDLASMIKHSLYEVLVKEKFLLEAVQGIEQTSDDFVNRLRSLDPNRKIAGNLYNVFYRLNGLNFGDYQQIAELIYANSFLTLILSVAFYQSI